MTSFASIRTTHLAHHVAQGSKWLARVDGGANTVELSYAAFEFRLAIERLGVLYWAQLLDRPLEEQEIRSSHNQKNTIKPFQLHRRPATVKRSWLLHEYNQFREWNKILYFPRRAAVLLKRYA